MSVALVTKHVMHTRRNVTGGLPGCTVFFPQYLINGKLFSGEEEELKKVTEHKMCFDFLYNFV
jgi:hypothetical protein